MGPVVIVSVGSSKLEPWLVVIIDVSSLSDGTKHVLLVYGLL